MTVSVLLKGIEIFKKYTDEDFNISCEHDEIFLTEIDEANISVEDKTILDKLGFFVDSEVDCWVHFT